MRHKWLACRERELREKSGGNAEDHYESRSNRLYRVYVEEKLSEWYNTQFEIHVKKLIVE